MLKLLNYIFIKVMPLIPKFLIKIFANQYVAGISIDNAIKKISKLNNKGLHATLDILGEHTQNDTEAINITNQYCKILEKIHAKNLNCNISIKPTHIGTDISNNLFLDNLSKIHSKSIDTNNFVRIDMENSKLTDITINAYKNRAKINSDIGIVLQAYLFRSEDDLNNLNENSNIRLCKGIYNESEQIAFKRPLDINDNYIKLLEKSFNKNIYVGIATHDPELINHSINLIKSMNIDKSMFEFQMLYGVPMEKHINTISTHGYKIRIYVPFGPEWYSYSIRRIKENPNISKYIIQNLFKK